MRITRMAEALHVLPRSGGLFDQNAGDMLRIEAVLSAHSQTSTAAANKAEAESRLKARSE